MSGFIESIINFISQTINYFGIFGVGIGMMIESACIPLPSEIILPIGGKMVADGIIGHLFWANLAAAVGSIAGSLLAYYVGYYGGRPFILKYGKYFLVHEKNFVKAEKTFNKYGEAAVGFGRLLPIIRTFISLPAGIARMDIKKFLIFSLIGMIPWNFLLIFLGFKYGESFSKVIGPLYHKFEYAVIIVFVAVILFFVIRMLLKKRAKGKKA
ncbi:MAG: DedA family protein [Clostridia bacterium]